jgi:hypothetical protein
MPFNTRTSGFSNSRDWRSFLSGAQPMAYANVATTLKAGHAWLTGRGRAQGWLGPRGRQDARGLNRRCSEWGVGSPLA